jgi:hypothetical protein
MAQRNLVQSQVILLLLAATGCDRAAGFADLTDAIPQLSGLLPEPPGLQSRPITLGGQNWTHCCLLAVNSSFEIDPINSSLVYSPNPFFGAPLPLPSDFSNSAHDGAGSFPCGASFDGNLSGAPQLRVPFNWCRNTCNGWQLSSRGALTQWVGPLVGFILPCLAFCLNIPRRRKLCIPQWVFSPSPEKALSVLLYIVRLPVALFFVTIDTISWLCVCFALAGPMLLSGVYETWLDMKLLRYLWTNIIDSPRPRDQNRQYSFLTKLRAQLLLLIVVGNIDLGPAGKLYSRKTLNAISRSAF